jgi:hypothetical protein
MHCCLVYSVVGSTEPGKSSAAMVYTERTQKKHRYCTRKVEQRRGCESGRQRMCTVGRVSLSAVSEEEKGVVERRKDERRGVER